MPGLDSTTMSPRPTFLQTVLNQPSQRYANPQPSQKYASSKPSQAYSSHVRASEKLATLPDNDMFFTPPTTDDDDDDLFSSRSATSSATSVSSKSEPPPDWSRRVRWLVPPDSMRPPPKPKSHTRSRSSSEPMSVLIEEDEDDDRRLRPASMSARVHIPSPLPVSAGASSSTGYTSLTLPRAAYTPTKHRVSTSVDITLSGLAQTTMATIAIASRPRPPTPAHLTSSLPSPLAFSSHTPPPSKVQPRQVLIQVWAVALDHLDALILDHRAARNDGLGFVPGRSLVGRAIETGWQVTDVARGDWVVAITDVRKCGALAEFVVVDRRRLHTVPRPSPHLSLEQLAVLPLAGVPAHRAVRTFAHLPRHARTLVLNAHDGPGLLATQELTALGLRVVAHVPGSWGSPAELRARAAGAPDVRCGLASDVLHDIPPAQFDGVLDTLGGKPLWAAARRILRAAGQFTTLVGDDAPGAMSPHAHFRSTMRALFAQRVGYQYVSPAADVHSDGADVRDSLAAIVRLAADGVLKPHVGRVLPFERAPDAFADPTAVVVRIVDW